MLKKLNKAISKFLVLAVGLSFLISNVADTEVFASDASSSRKVDVWDFGGVQASGNIYNNNISQITLDNLTTVAKGGCFSGNTSFGDLAITNPCNNDRLYYYNAQGTPGTKGYNGNYSGASASYDDGYKANGCYYANGSAGNTRRYLTINNVASGDKISVYGGTSNGNEKLHFVYLGSSGTEDIAADFLSTKATKVDFIAKYSGSYKIYVTASSSGKPYFNRVVRTPGVNVNGKINLNGKNISSSLLDFINQTTGEITKVKLNSDNTFNTVLPTGYRYVAALEGTNTAISDTTKTVTTSISNISTGINNVSLDVINSNLATIRGSIYGFDAKYDLSNLQIKLVPQSGNLSPEVSLSINKTDKTFTAQVKQGEAYTAVISGADDYNIVNGSSVNVKSNTSQNIQVAKKPVYSVSGKFMNVSSSALIKGISFTNVDDGHTYSGTVTNGGYTANLRDGSYTVKAVCNENYATSTHVVVNGQNTTKDIQFSQINGWNLVNVTNGDIASGNYKGLILKNGTGGFSANGNALSAKPGSSIVIPVTKGEIVTVSGWYSGEIYFNQDKENKLIIPSNSTAASPATLSYKATTTGTVTLNIAGTDTAYLTSINCANQINRASDLYVGDSTKQNNYATIKDALDAAAEMNPTCEAQRITIHIAPGVYRAQLKISTPYITLVNSNPSKEVKITWYYGFGYEYYSVGSDGFYNKDCALDKYSKGNVSNGEWGASVYLTSSAAAFKAEGIVFENSFNKYLTQEELDDGVALCKNFPQSTSINVERTPSLDVTSKSATERATAVAIDANDVEFKNCSFLGSQDTLYTGTSGAINQYYNNCFIEGNTDYIFGDGNVIFDSCTLNFCGYGDKASPGYITAAKDTATYGYLFRNCTVTANNNKMQTAGFFGRPWGTGAKVTFLDTKLQSSSIIDPKGWTDMSGASPENAHYAEYNTTYNKKTVDTSLRRVKALTDTSKITNIKNYLGNLTSTYYSEPTYISTFHSNGGTDIASETIGCNGILPVPIAAPLKIGYTFAGWYTDAVLNTPYTFGTNLNGDIDLYAKWILISGLKLNLTSNNGTVNGQLTSYNYGDTVNLTAVPNANYNFVNWTDGTGKVLSINPKYIFKIVGNTHITANFAKSSINTNSTTNTVNNTTNGNNVSSAANIISTKAATGSKSKASNIISKILPKTGYVIDETVLIFIGTLIILIGLIAAVLAKKKSVQ